MPARAVFLLKMILQSPLSMAATFTSSSNLAACFTAATACVVALMGPDSAGLLVVIAVMVGADTLAGGLRAIVDPRRKATFASMAAGLVGKSLRILMVFGFTGLDWTIHLATRGLLPEISAAAVRWHPFLILGLTALSGSEIVSIFGHGRYVWSALRTGPWQRAAEALAAGNLAEAIDTANDVQTRIRAKGTRRASGGRRRTDTPLP